jgi:mono/diheme cytochrome c family protein
MRPPLLIVTARAIAALLASTSLTVPATVAAKDRDKCTLNVAAAESPAEPEPAQATASANPLSAKAEAIEQGKQLFLTWCAQCHGTSATGGKYGADLTIFALGFKEFLVTVKNGRVEKQMPPWKDVLDENSVTQIAAYLESVAQPGANWK